MGTSLWDRVRELVEDWIQGSGRLIKESGPWTFLGLFLSFGTFFVARCD